MSLKRGLAGPPRPAGEISWHGAILSMHPHIQFLRSFNQRSHSYLGYLLHLMDTAANEGVSWQVGVRWEEVLPVYFTRLAATAEPDDYAQGVTGMVNDFVRYDTDKYQRKAQSGADAAQRKALR